MVKVYQTIIGNFNAPKGQKGNCMQAAIASLFELELDKVPHFIESGIDWFSVYWEFLRTQGYQYSYGVDNPSCLGYCGEDNMRTIQSDKGVKGDYFYGIVYSPKYFDKTKYCDGDYIAPTHAVIIDKEFNIVHDPNPQYKDIKKYPLADLIGYNGVKGYHVYKKL